MRRAGNLGVQDGLVRDGPEPLDEPAGLGDGRKVVRAAVDHEERRGIRADVADGGDVLVGGAVVLDRGLHDPLAEQRHRPIAGAATLEEVDEVVDAVEGDARGDGGVGRLELGLVPGLVRGERHHRGEVAAGGAAGDADQVRVAAVLGDVLAHPGERALAVDQVLGPRRLRAQAVVDRDAHPTLGGEVQHEREALLALVADDPGAAVDLEQHRREPRLPCGGVARPVDVEHVPLAVRAVLEVLDALDAAVVHQEGEDARASTWS